MYSLCYGKVYLVWALDAVHTALIAASLWDYFALAYGDASKTDYINVYASYLVQSCL